MIFKPKNLIANKSVKTQYLRRSILFNSLFTLILCLNGLLHADLLAQASGRSIENCTDGVDNDFDCLTDCEDPDCGVSALERNIEEPIKCAVGQDDFTSMISGTTATNFNGPKDVHQDPTTGKVFIADELNHRVLRYGNVNDFIQNKPAEAVLGQPDFSTNTSDLSEDKLKNPRSVFIDDFGTLWVADYYNARVLRFDNASSIPTGSPANGVLGQKNFTTRDFATSEKRMKYPTSVYVDDLGALWVTDYARVLRFDNATSMSNGENASAVFGQTSFTNSVFGSSDILFGKANDVVKICDRLYVADSFSDRIVWFDSPNTLGNGPTMDGVIGQLDFVADAFGTSQNQFRSPTRLAVDEDNTLYIVDGSNSRVVTIKDIASKSFMTDFDKVLNQTDFVTSAVGLSAIRCDEPEGIAVLKSGNQTYIAMADNSNNRIQVWGNDIFTDELTDISGFLTGEDPAITASFVYTITSQPNIGTVTLDNAITGAFVYIAPGALTLTVDSTVTFDYIITNGNSCSKTNTVAIHLMKSVTGPTSTEDCTDGIDNDDDCLVDCDDPDCGVSFMKRDIEESIKFAVGQVDFNSMISGTTDSTYNVTSDVHQDPTSGKVFVSDVYNHRVLRYASVDAFILNKPPDAVLGQPNFVTGTSGRSATKMNRPSSVFIDDSGTLWVADEHNYRILRFDNASTISSGASADGVLGQSDFTVSEFETKQDRMKFPRTVYVDDLGTLWVADFRRVLRFDNAASKANGADADAIIGQSSYTALTYGTSAVNIKDVTDIVKICDRLYLLDKYSNRITWYDSPNTLGNGPAIDGVIGQVDFVSSGTGTSQNQFKYPYKMAADEENNLYIVDAGNNRIVTINDVTSKSFLTDFDGLLNQSIYTSGTSGLSSTRCEDPDGIAILKSGNRNYLAMADGYNNRIQVWADDLYTDENTNITSILPGEDTSLSPSSSFAIVSQPVIGTITINNSTTGEFTYIAPATSSLISDTLITFEYGLLNANMCLKLNTIAIHLSPASGSMVEICNDLLDNDLDGLIDCEDPDCGVSIHGDKFLSNATSVYGQPDFTTKTSATTQAGLFSPRKIVIDPTSQKVFVLENQNKRVLRFASIISLKNGDLPEAVLGQFDFVSKAAALTQSGCTSPIGMVIDSNGSLFVSDYLNHRVLRYDNASTKASGANADGVLGQVDFTSNVAATTQSGLYNPSGMAVDEFDNLYVLCAGGGDRVLRYDNAASKANGANADQVLGKSTFTASGGACTINGINGPHSVVINNGNLYLSDFMCRRIVIWDDVLSKANGEDADRVIGQPDFTSTTSVISQDQHRGGKMSFNEAGDLILSDYNNNRILFFKDADALGNQPFASTVLGQDDYITGASGISDHKFASPQGTISFVQGDQLNLAVCDANNNRILFFPAGISTNEMTAISDTLNGKDLASTGILTFAIIAQPDLGIVTIDDPYTGAFTYTPTGACMLAADSTLQFTYSVTNGNSCSKNSVFSISVADSGPCAEICNDGLDNDSDGFIDCIDPDCFEDTSCSDHDGDSINDVYDLDDDNDGLLDDEECENMINSISAGGAFASRIHWLDFNGPDFIDGTLDLNDVLTITSTNGDVLTITAIAMSSSASITTPIETAGALYQHGYQLDFPSIVIQNAGSESYTFSISATDFLGYPVSANIVATDSDAISGSESCTFSSNGSPWIILEELTTDASPNYNLTGLGTNSVSLSGTTTSPIGVPLLLTEGVTTLDLIQNVGSGDQSFALGWLVSPTNCADFDLDGIVNSMDVDSDNDGLFDVIEAGGSDPDMDGIIGSGAIIDSDNDGLSNIVDADNSGTALFDGDNDGDLSKDRIDSDSDGDGCPDVIEAGFPDSDGDGKLGGLVPPTVNTDGKVTSGGM